MKILHVYDQSNKHLAHYVSELCRSLAGRVDCMTADDAKTLRRVYASFQPAIVHQHGHAIGEVPAASRLVVSPHGEETDSKNAYAVIARSAIEARRLGRQRVETVQDPLITKTITFAEASDRLLAVYQRVMDSHPLELLNTDSRRALAILLKGALRGDRRWLTAEELQWPLHIDWRRLYIYAEYEGVMPLLRQGLQTIGVSAPEKEKTTSYLPNGYAIPSPMTDKSIVELLNDIRVNGPCLLRLTDMDRALHNDEINEEKLLETLEEKKLKPLFQSVLQLLSEQTLLTEGFMPCQPIDNQTTQRLRQQLQGRLKP